MKIAIIGATITGNHGAEAMLSTLVARLKSINPNVEINVFSYYPKQDAECVKDNAINICSATPLATVWHLFFALLYKPLRLLLPFHKLFPKDVKTLHSCDMLLDIQGVSFNDGRIKFLPFKITCLWPALLLGVKVVKLSQSMGPFNQTLNRMAAKCLLPHCSMIFARGDISYSAVKTLLGKSNERLKNCADLALHFKPEDGLSPYGDEAAQKALGFINQHQKVVGIIPSNIVHKKLEANDKSYVDLMVQLITRIQQQNMAVVVFPHASRQNTDSEHNNDLSIIAKLQDAVKQSSLNQEQIYFCNEVFSARAIDQLIQVLGATITSRFHAMISSLKYATPCLVMGVGHKYFETMQKFEMEDMVVDYKNPESCLSLLDKLLTEQDALKTRITKQLPAMLQSSEAQYTYLKQQLSAHE